MTASGLHRVLPALLLCVPALASCGPALPDPGADAEALRRSSLEALGGDVKHCAVPRKATEPDLFGWDSGARAKVKATAEQGLVVVHFEQHGCDITIAVLNCTSTKTSYHYTPRHAEQTRFAGNDAELYAHFPVAVAELRARLGANRSIRADYRMEGIDMIPIGTPIEPADLRGSECEEATHVVRAIHRGAFAVAAASTEELRAGASLLEASARHRLGVFDGDGYQQACETARTRGVRSSGCDEPLRIELQPLDHPARARRPPEPPEPEEVVTYTIPPALPEPTPPIAPAALTPAPRPWAPAPWAPAPWTGGGSRSFAGCPSGMASIRGGTFTMGPDDEDDGSRRPVTLPGYCLDLTEVTVGAYARCPTCRAPAAGPLCNAPGAGKDDHPQNCVSWDDAVAYCTWAGKALPTEAQWEYAARGGSSQRRWPWGDAPPAHDRACWNRWEVQGRGTCPAGEFPDGAFGLKDMAGNVWEWVDAWYGPFAPGDRTPTPTSGAGRVLRGGGWSSTSAANLLTASRAATWPTNRDDYLGFRCAL